MIYGLTRDESTRVPVKVLCMLTGVSRSGFYRFLSSASKRSGKRVGFDMEMRDMIQHICLDMSSYGYRRVTKALQRIGYNVNHKRVLRLMGEDNLLCVRRKRFIRTTDSQHGLRIYPNLAGKMTITGINQLWVADITYIRLLREFVYLAVILDAFSRRVIGWALRRDMTTKLSLAALGMALKDREVQPGLVHHSDRGVQYAAEEYVETLKAHSVKISMSRKGNPYDNAMAESFMKTLKHEEVLINEYENINDAHENISYFIERVYNRKRLHSALNYKPPVEFETEYSNLDEITTHKTSISLKDRKSVSI